MINDEMINGKWQIENENWNWKLKLWELILNWTKSEQWIECEMKWMPRITTNEMNFQASRVRFEQCLAGSYLVKFDG